MKSDTIKRKIKQYIAETHGEIKPIWLQQINDLIELKTIIDRLKEDISTNGMFAIDRYRQKKVNPALEMLNKILPKYNTILNDLNLTPKQYKKLKEVEIDDTDDYIDKLTSGWE